MVAFKIDNLKMLAIDHIDPFLGKTLEKMNQIGVGIVKISNVTNGRQLLELLDRGVSFEVVLLDIDMPGATGMDILHQLSIRQYAGSIIMHSDKNSAKNGCNA